MAITTHDAPVRTDDEADGVATFEMLDSDAAVTGVYLHVGGKAKCKGIIFKVQTTYADAWTTSGSSSRSTRVNVPRLRVWFSYEKHGGHVEKIGQNTSKVTASEQLRGVNPGGICTRVRVTGEAKLNDGRVLRGSTQLKP